MSKTSRSLNWRVLDEFERLIDESGMTRAEIIARSGMRRNTFFVKMRGDTALTTDDIAKIAGAIGYTPDFVMEKALRPALTVVGSGNTDALDEIDEATAEEIADLRELPRAALIDPDKENHQTED